MGIELDFLAETALAQLIATQAVPSGGYPLAIGGTVTHATRCVAGLAAISGVVFTDAAGTLFIEQSINGTNWDIVTTIDVLASIATPVDVPVYASLARARYVNGAVAQTVFRANIVARASSGQQSGGGVLGAPGNVNSGIVIFNTTALLGAGATLLGTIFRSAPNGAAVGTRNTGYDIVRGFGQSDVAGTVTILQALQAADIVAPFTNCFQAAVGVPAGGVGASITQVIVAPFVAVLYTNGGAPQTRQRCWAAMQ